MGLDCMRRKARELRVDEDKKPCRDFSQLIGMLIIYTKATR